MLLLFYKRTILDILQSFVLHYLTSHLSFSCELWLQWLLVNSSIQTYSYVFWYKTNTAFHCTIDAFLSSTEYCMLRAYTFAFLPSIPGKSTHSCLSETEERNVQSPEMADVRKTSVFWQEVKLPKPRSRSTLSLIQASIQFNHHLYTSFMWDHFTSFSVTKFCGL